MGQKRKETGKIEDFLKEKPTLTKEEGAHERAKGPVTLYLDRQRFELFRQRAKEKGYSASELVDELIERVLGGEDS